MAQNQAQNWKQNHPINGEAFVTWMCESQNDSEGFLEQEVEAGEVLFQKRIQFVGSFAEKTVGS